MSKITKTYRNFSLMFLWISLSLSVVALLSRSIIAFQSEYLNNSAEAAGLIGLFNLIENKILYPARFSEPYTIFLYNPLLPYLCDYLIRWLSISDQVAQVMLVRGVVAISFLFLLGTLYTLCRELKCKSSSLFFLAFILGMTRLFDYLGTSRNDIPALFLELLGVLFFIFFIKKSRLFWVFLALLSCHLAFWIRQSSVVIPFSILFWLFHKKLFRHFFSVLILNLVFASIYFIFMFYTSGTSFFDHVFLANIRPWKPIDRSLLTYSNASFFLCSGLFIFLFVRNLKVESRRSDVDRFCLLSAGLSSFLAFFSWFRAGGDFNYFFLPLLLIVPFVLKDLELNWKKKTLQICVSFQLLLIGLIYSLKIVSSVDYLTIPFAQEMRNLRQEINVSPHQFLLFSGKFSESTSIYLRDLALHGPEITSGCWLSTGSHAQLRWLWEQANRAVLDRRVVAIVQSEPECGRKNGIELRWPKHFLEKQVVTDWLCIHKIKELNTPTK